MKSSVGNVLAFEKQYNSNLYLPKTRQGSDGATSPLLSQQSNYVSTSSYAQSAGNEVLSINPHKASDQILPSDPITKIKAGLSTATSIPEYAVRGLKGDPNANFYEYLKLGKVPYCIGGPMLVAVALAAKNNFNPQSQMGIVKNAKSVATGVVMYYAAAALAQKVIDGPVKLFRGVDLNHPYRDVIDLRATTPSGISPKKKEYHKVFESIDFTRWDLIYKHKQANPDVVNADFDKIAKRYGIDENVNDSDSTLKGSIKKTIIMSRAWKYALTVPFVTLALGLASQNSWQNVGATFKNDMGQIFSPGSNLKAKVRVKKLAEAANSNIVKPLAKSFVDLWKGSTKASGVLGKAAIITSVLAPIYANYRILSGSSVRADRAVDKAEYGS